MRRLAALATAQALAMAVALASALMSCAAPLVLGRETDPMALLSPGALCYVGIGHEGLSSLLPGILPAKEMESLAPFLDRTTRAVLAVFPPENGHASYEAALAGAYPFRQAGFAFSGRKGWRKKAIKTGYRANAVASWVNEASGLNVAFPGPNLVLAASRPLDALVAALSQAGAASVPTVLPAEIAADSQADMILWVPEPFMRLGRAFLGSGIDIPCRGLLVAFMATEPPQADAAAVKDRSWEVKLAFLMESSEDARLYRPAARVAWYAMGRLLFPTAAGVTFSLSANAITASGFRLSASALSATFAALMDPPSTPKR